MADNKGANRARIILEAVRLASSAQVPSLHLLIARESNILQLELVLRILLTYLPESTEPTVYTDLLHQIANSAVHAPPQSSPRPVQNGKELSDKEARYQVRRLHLLPLAEEQDLQAGCTDLLSLFLIHRARTIDLETGSIPEIQELLEPFLNRDPYLRTWTVSNILPLRRLNYEYYPDLEDPYTLEAFERLEGRPAIDSFLARSARVGGTETIQSGRDIRGVVGPWIYGESSRKRRKTHHDRRRSSLVSPRPAGQVASSKEEECHTAWSDVNDWLLDLALRDFAAAAETLEQWDGPSDIDYDGYNDHEDLNVDISQTLTLCYAQVGLSMLYANSETTPSTFEKSSGVLRKVSHLSGLDAHPALEEIHTSSVPFVSKDYLDQLSEVYLLHNALLRRNNPMTSSTQASVSFASLVLRSCVILQKLGNPKSCRATAGLAAFAKPEEQMNELHKTLQKVPIKTRDDNAWAAVRQQILWLRNWQFQASGIESDDGKESTGIFGKVKRMNVEIEMLRALLRASCYDLAVHVYCMQDQRPIADGTLEKTILSVAMSFYDGASNGNRTRGGVRKASEIVAAFQNHFPQSQHFHEANALLAATHSMSFYSLTLQHGVPFQPVNIRASRDPLSLIGKILEQNPRSYTKLDDLIEIGRNLVRAKLGSVRDPSSPVQEGAKIGSPNDNQDQQLHESPRRIISMASEAALTEGDFDTAYSYIVNRLSPALPTPDQPPEATTANDRNDDDISWRAAYLAGRSPPSSSSSSSSPSLRRLEQRLELLSLSLLLAPPPHLVEILHVWRGAETDLTAHLARESAEEDRWNSKADHGRTNIIPGGFAPSAADMDRAANQDITRARSAKPKPSGNNNNNNAEDAPMGLFDVARGAAKAFQKSAFPLRDSAAAAAAAASGDGGRVGGKMSPTSGLAGSGEDSGSEGKGGRVRKRDVVANAVTGGLASGIGWVIGAPPAGGKG